MLMLTVIDLRYKSIVLAFLVVIAWIEIENDSINDMLGMQIMPMIAAYYFCIYIFILQVNSFRPCPITPINFCTLVD